MGVGNPAAKLRGFQHPLESRHILIVAHLHPVGIKTTNFSTKPLLYKIAFKTRRGGKIF